MIQHPFPIFLDLTGRPCLVMGGGPEADRKAALLRRSGAQVRRAVEFHPDLLVGAALAIVAGVPAEVGEEVSQAARQRGIPVNVVDEPRLCSFIMPAIVDRAPVVIAISTGGTAPALARLLRAGLDWLLHERLGDLASLAGRFRPLVRRRLPEAEARRCFWKRIFTGEIADLALAGKPATRAFADALDGAAAQPQRELARARESVLA